MRSTIFLLITCVVAAGCSVLDSSPASKLGDADPEVPMIQTEQTTFSYGGGATKVVIAATYTNETDDTVLIDPCGQNTPSFALERKEGKWETVYQSVCALIYVPPFEVAPESTFVASQLISLTSGERADEESPVTKYRFEREPGTYRLAWNVREASTGELLPKKQRVSNEFEITG